VQDSGSQMEDIALLGFWITGGAFEEDGQSVRER